MKFDDRPLRFGKFEPTLKKSASLLAPFPEKVLPPAGARKSQDQDAFRVPGFVIRALACGWGDGGEKRFSLPSVTTHAGKAQTPQVIFGLTLIAQKKVDVLADKITQCH